MGPGVEGSSENEMTIFKCKQSSVCIQIAVPLNNLKAVCANVCVCVWAKCSQIYHLALLLLDYLWLLPAQQPQKSTQVCVPVSSGKGEEVSLQLVTLWTRQININGICGVCGGYLSSNYG